MERNRLKRRLRAIVSEQATYLPAGAYVVTQGPGGPSLEFDELKVAMSRALERATAAPVPAAGGRPYAAATRSGPVSSP